MPKMWKPTSPWIKKGQAAHKRALGSYQAVNNGLEPCYRTPFNVPAKLARVIILCAAALGQKRGQLPAGSLAAWSAWFAAPVEGFTQVVFAKAGSAQVVVPMRNLNAWAAPAVEEIEEAAAMPMAA